MSATAGRTGAGQTLGASEEQVFTAASGYSATTIRVKNRSTSPAAVTVRIPELHGTSTSVGATLQPGESELFRVNNGGITSVYLTGNTAIVDWYPVSLTRD